MLSPHRIRFLRRLAVLALAVAGAAVLSGQASAQEQERKLLDRIQHPNMELHAEGFEKSFETKGSNRDREAYVRPFGFLGRTANMKTGDGLFHARSYNDGRSGFRTENYAVRRATVVDHQTSPQANRLFATSAVAVHDDRAANQSAYTRTNINSAKPFLVPGKRQDTIDDLRSQKNLTIDQVREILNKSR